ncbi:hypothetical protein BH09GEM1_BH09GEM1_12650 [soil metagenome]
MRMSLALHYRAVPRLAGYAHRAMRELARDLGGTCSLQAGKRVVELRPCRRGTIPGAMVVARRGRGASLARQFPRYRGCAIGTRHFSGAATRWRLAGRRATIIEQHAGWLVVETHGANEGGQARRERRLTAAGQRPECRDQEGGGRLRRPLQPGTSTRRHDDCSATAIGTGSPAHHQSRIEKSVHNRSHGGAIRHRALRKLRERRLIAVLERPEHEELRRAESALCVRLVLGEAQRPQDPSQVIDGSRDRRLDKAGRAWPGTCGGQCRIGNRFSVRARARRRSTLPLWGVPRKSKSRTRCDKYKPPLSGRLVSHYPSARFTPCARSSGA